MTVEQHKTDTVMPLVLLICIVIVCFSFVAGMAEAIAMDTNFNYRPLQRQSMVQVSRANSIQHARQSANRQWVNRQNLSNQVTSSRQSQESRQMQSIGQFGDRMYIVQPQDQPSLLAREVTGNSSSWPDIARYNRLQEDSYPVAGQLLYIPQSLILLPAEAEAHRPRPHNSQSTSNPANRELLTKQSSDAQLLAMAFDRQQYSNPGGNSKPYSADLNNHRNGKPNVLNPVSPTVADQDLISTSGTATRNVDMFAGEARVFGKVKVSRVAVGNGAILRAEVLDNGELLTIAQTEGSSSLHLWHKDGSHSSFNVRVSATDPEIRVRLDKTIRMRVKMIEFRKSALERIGIDWGDSIEGPVFATVGDAATNSLFRPSQQDILGESSTLPLTIQPFSSFFGIATQLSSRINLLVNRGDAEMLAEPVLSCGNGGTARFLAGGEVPYPTVGSNGQTTVNFREYGIRLEISPRVDEFNNIQTDIMTEVSSIDASVTVLGAPGLLTRRTQTQVSSRAGSTIVIAGLMQLEQGSDKDSLPGLGRLPVVGKLFRSDSSNRSVSELVIFITPEVVEPGVPVMPKRDEQTHEYVLNELQKARQQLQQFRNQ